MPSTGTFLIGKSHEQRRDELHRMLERYRDQFEKRRRNDLQKVELALRLLREVQVSATEDLLAGAIASDDDNSKGASQLEIVRSAARTFGPTPFSVDALCQRAEETHLGCYINRRIASRRLYDLRRAIPPVIEVITKEVRANEKLPMKQQINLYRYTGPP